MKSFSERGFAHYLVLLFIAIAIVLGVILVSRPTFFKPKASNDQTRVEVVDEAGNTITQTSSQQVKLKLTYVAPVPLESPSQSVNFPEDLEDVTKATDHRFGARDESWHSMDTAKIIDNPNGGYLAVYHTNFGNNVFKTFLATSHSMVGWLDWHNIVQLDDHASMPTVFSASNGGYVVAEEKTVPEGNYLKFFYFDNIDNLLQNHPSATYSAPHSLSTCNEGTPNVYSATINGDIHHSTIDVGFHYQENCHIDREARGTLTNFNSWSAQPDTNLNSKLLGGDFGLTSNSDFGQRDYVQINGKSYLLMEVQSTFGDWTSWRLYLYDFSTGQMRQFPIHRASGNPDSANPHISFITSPSGKPALVITTFIPSEGSAQNESPGELIYYKEFGQSAASPTTAPFPTSFRVANSESDLASAQEQSFSSNGQTINWTFTGGNGQKTVYAQFKVNGAWDTPLSTTVTLALPSPTPTETSLSPSPTPSQVVSASPSPSPSPSPLVGDINGDHVVNQADANLLLQNFGKTGTASQGDINGDGKVDIYDYNLLIQNYGKTQ